MLNYNFKYAFRNIIGKSAALYYPIYGIRPRYREQFVRSNTQFVIEGFPRSANTFAVEAIKFAHRKQINVASHLHVPAQVIRAVKFRIPTLVLIRNPKDAVTSLLVRDPQLPAWQALRAYTLFYESLLPYYTKFCLATFESVIKSFDRIIMDVNIRFGTNLKVPQLTRKNLQEIFKLIDESNRKANHGKQTHLARPSPLRIASKKMALKRVEDVRNRKALIEAQATYRTILEANLKYSK